ncbi:hypothetical protein OHB05_37065 [Streptomyces sp. NBC_00638]|uniref:hypothetical protein n=1 Tax=Streptomyces sp. NBC_00638 TaxID=2975794 RepID=UPI00224D3C54|nr:hypothetical protein [Streptomyces sp. NBC_00638]MCX5008187.1 hypothetical protein [Streptomyces sp. NBC_00638]
MGVVVTLLDQGGDIEQPPVEPVRGQVGQHLVREDVEVIADGLGAYAAEGAGRAGHVGGLLAAAEVRESYDITGEESDGVLSGVGGCGMGTVGGGWPVGHRQAGRPGQ